MKNLRLLFLFTLLCPGFSHGNTSQSPAPSCSDNEIGWSALPKGRPFGILPSDPRDLRLGLRANNKSEMEGDVAGYRSLVGHCENGRISASGIEGAAYFQMKKEGSKFPLHSSDGLFGLYAETRQGPWAWQLRFTHISAHLSDGLTGTRPSFVYSREFLVLRLARDLVGTSNSPS
jgi:hypothetical protein